MHDEDWRNFGRPSRVKKALPEGWRPARDISAFEEQRLADMHLWAQAHGVEMADWGKFFELWLQKKPPAGRQDNGRAGSILAAADRLTERFERAGATGDYVPGSAGPEPLALDKPPSTDGLRKLPPR
jgi:hypothetical protein